MPSAVNKKRGIEKSRLFLPLAGCFVVTFLSLSIVFNLSGIGFFGPRSILISDMRGQYINFFMALRNGDVFYTNGAGLSGSFAGTFAYYLSSPLSLVIFLFQKEQIQTALLFLYFLKMSFASATFGYMAHRLFGVSGAAMILFSSCYSLMSFIFFFFINIFWLDAFCWLPLLVIETVKLAKSGKAKWLPLFLGMLFLSNFYISYITGLFLLFFFLYLAVSTQLSFRETAVRVGNLILSALFGALLSAVTLLPAIKNFSRSFGVESFDGYDTLNFTPKQFLLKLFNGSYDSIGNFAAPTIFCGVLIFILALSFFFLKSITKREKIAAGSTILLFLLSFLLPTLDRIWHGFSYPNAFAYRYAFCFSFFVIYLALKAFLRIKEIPYFLPILFFIPAVFILLFRNTLLRALPAASLIATFSALVVYPILLLSTKKASAPVFSKTICGALAVLTVLELSLNGTLILRSMDDPTKETGYPFPSYSQWTTTREQSLTLLEQAEKASLYRVTNTDPLGWNEGLSLGYNGVSSFSSDYDPKIQTLFTALGYGGSFKGYWYRPGSLSADSFFGVRYVLSDVSIPYMSPLASKDGLTLYENKHALPPAFCTNADITGFILSDDVSENLNGLLNVLTLSQTSDMSEIDKLEKIKAFSLETTRWEGQNIEGIITAPSNCILQTTLPYDRNYTVKIDKKKVETFITLDCLLAANIPDGTHTVEISYSPKEARIGGVISLLTLTGWLCLIFIRKSAPIKR